MKETYHHNFPPHSPQPQYFHTLHPSPIPRINLPIISREKTPPSKATHLSIRIIPLLTQLGHGRRRILERKKRRVRVRLETFLQVRWRRVGYGRGSKEPGTADPNIETAPGIQDVVDEGEG